MSTKASLSFEKKMIFCFAGIIAVFTFFPLLIPSIPAPYWFHETFFNTLKIAENFKEKGFPTFDGVTPTNDFSLLWGLFLSGLSAVVSSETTAFFIFVRLILGLFLGISLWLFNRLIHGFELQPEKEVQFMSSSFLAALYLYSAFTGSDATLAIPAVFFSALCLLRALKNPTIISGIICGLSVSLCAFTRFDCAAYFLTVLLVFYFQFNGKEPITTKQTLILASGIVIGLIPLMAYADILQTKFGTPVPMELLSWGTAQNVAPWRFLVVVFFEPLRYMIRIPQTPALITFPIILLLLVSYVSFPWLGQKQTPKDTVFYALIWHPIVYLVSISVFTFITLPEYSFYPLAIGAPAALLFAANEINSRVQENEKKQAKKAWLILSCLFLILALTVCTKSRAAFYRSITHTVSEFSDKHPGRYAMSTGAGITSFVTQKDFVRLDGMAGDLPLLKNLDAQKELKETFKNYNIDYYIAINPGKNDNCYSAREPVQNRFGGTNKGMSDWLCTEPVFEKDATSEYKITIFKTDFFAKSAL